VLLQSESSPVQIIYSFNPQGNVTEYTRELKYNLEDLKSISPDPNEVNRLMRAQSEQAVKQLKQLVEKNSRRRENSVPVVCPPFRLGAADARFD
jgi:hypothetical protein